MSKREFNRCVKCTSKDLVRICVGGYTGCECSCHTNECEDVIDAADTIGDEAGYESVRASKKPDDVAEMSDVNVVNAMRWVQDIIGGAKSQQCGRIGMAIAFASQTFEIPKVTDEVMDQMRVEYGPDATDEQISMMARFALVGYAVMNCIEDGFSLKKGFLETPQERQEKKTLIISKPDGTIVH